MHTPLHTTLVSLWCLLAVVGCAGQPPPEVMPPPQSASPQALRGEVDAYIADVRRLIADMDKVDAEWDSLLDVRGLKDSPVFNETFRILDGFFVEAMKSRNVSLYVDKVQAFDATVQRQGDRNLHQFIQGIIGYHARLIQLTVQVAELSKQIDAMEPRLQDLKKKLLLAVAQNASGYNYTALIALLHNEQTRFVRKVQEWMGDAPQTQ
jgi:hypothetical protein